MIVVKTLLYIIEFQTGASVGKIRGRQGHTQGRGAKGLEAPPGSQKFRLVVILTFEFLKSDIAFKSYEKKVKIYT